MTAFAFRARHRRRLILAIGLTLVAACTEMTGRQLSYDAPPGPGDVTVDIGNASAATVASRLRSAGIEVVSVSQDLVRARASDTELIDCGELIQSIDGNRAEISGNAPSAVIFDFDQPGDILLREVKADTTIEIRVGSGVATVGQRHTVTIRHRTATGSRAILSDTKTFEGATATRFADGSICSSSDYVKDAIG